MFQDTQSDYGQRKLLSSSDDILGKCEMRNFRLTTIGAIPCRVSVNSKDGRGRCQRAMYWEPQKKSNFRPWHITWIATYGLAPVGLQYSHRCHEENCCEPTHGIWEDDVTNKSRNKCQTCSHVVLPSGQIVLCCLHVPACLRPIILQAGDSRLFLNLSHYQNVAKEEQETFEICTPHESSVV